MFVSIATEFIGTFIFLLSILIADKYYPKYILPIIAVVALLAMIYIGMYTSGGHFNPAISTVMLLRGSIKVDKFLGYVVAQICGGILALLWFQTIVKNRKNIKMNK
jgi:aquaporin Z